MLYTDGMYREMSKGDDSSPGVYKLLLALQHALMTTPIPSALHLRSVSNSWCWNPGSYQLHYRIFRFLWWNHSVQLIISFDCLSHKVIPSYLLLQNTFFFASRGFSTIKCSAINYSFFLFAVCPSCCTLQQLSQRWQKFLISWRLFRGIPFLAHYKLNAIELSWTKQACKVL